MQFSDTILFRIDRLDIGSIRKAAYSLTLNIKQMEPTVNADYAEPVAAAAPPPAPVAIAKKPRKANAWIKHVRAYRVENADKIKSEKLGCGAISKLARASYKPKAKCATCGH
jgi:hypothetical protein